MKKERLNTTKALVKEILENDDEARNSDNYLYLRVLKTIASKNGDSIDLNRITVPTFLMSMEKMGFPPFESVRRTRQKLQEKCPWLAASDEVERFRDENEEVYLEFARG